MLHRIIMGFVLLNLSLMQQASNQVKQGCYRFNPYQLTDAREPVSVLTVDQSSTLDADEQHAAVVAQGRRHNKSRRKGGQRLSRTPVHVQEERHDCRQYLYDAAHCGAWDRIENALQWDPILTQQAIALPADSPLIAAMILKFNENQKSYSDRLDLMQMVLQHTPQDQLNLFDRKGQSLAHKLTWLHYAPELIAMMHQAGVDFSQQTIAPDMYQGSTIASNLIGHCAHPRNFVCYQNSDFNCFVVDRKAWQAVNFLVWMFKTYPQVVGFKSGYQQATCWSLLTHVASRSKKKSLDLPEHQSLRYGVISQLTGEDIKKISNALNSQVTAGKLPYDEALKIVGEMYAIKEVCQKDCRFNKP